jgi:hypothetical protein
LNIYIYGSQSFKKEIHQTLEHANIRFKLGDNTLINDITNLKELKEIIKNNPNDIYLIDDTKIIKKNSLNKKLKFLAPKDGIDEEILLDSGIADLSIDSVNEIPRYILKKYEEIKLNEPKEVQINNDFEENEQKIELDDELSLLLVKEDILESKIEENHEENSLEDAFGIPQDVNLDSLENLIGSINNEEDDLKTKEVDNLNDIFGDDFGLSNSSLDYDDDNTLNKEEEDFFSNFLVENENVMEDFDESSTVEEEFDDVDFFAEILSKSDHKKDEEMESKDIIEDNNSIEDLDFSFINSFTDDSDVLIQNNDNEIENKTLTYEQPKGVRMIDEDFSELDSLNEKDLLEALSGIGSGVNSLVKEDKSSYQDISKETSSIEILSGTNTNELAQLLSTLLNNKTLEITIKIKD